MVESREGGQSPELGSVSVLGMLLGQAGLAVAFDNVWLLAVPRDRFVACSAPDPDD
jgi:hypothetical protein